MADVQARLRQCFEAVFPDLTPEEVERASPDTVAAWDSLANVTLMTLVEDEFNVEISEEDLARLRSFSGLREYLTDGE